MLCNRCNGKMNIMAIAEQKKRGLIKTFIWIMLALCTFGLIIIIPLLRGKKTKTVSYAVCQSCGYKKKLR